MCYLYICLSVCLSVCLLFGDCVWSQETRACLPIRLPAYKSAACNFFTCAVIVLIFVLVAVVVVVIVTVVVVGVVIVVDDVDVLTISHSIFALVNKSNI